MHHHLTIYKALADPNRLKLVDLLLNHDLCVGALAKRLGISKPAVSQHLKVLRKAGLVKGEKRGYYAHYSIERDVLLLMADEVKTKVDRSPNPQGVCHKTIPESTEIYDGRRIIDMCNDCCQKPENLKNKHKECSPEQIKTCNGDTKDHPCKDDKKQK